jgi:peptide deformylase
MIFNLGPHQSLIETSTDWVFGQDGDSHVVESSMIEFMVNNRGIGLAANQLGSTKKVFVMGSHNIPGFPKPFAVFNPIIIEASKETELSSEGCLSYPELFLMVKRPKTIVAEYQNSDGDTITSEMSGLIARCFQHEYDHLMGICFVDKVSSMRLQLAMKKLRKHNKL